MLTLRPEKGRPPFFYEFGQAGQVGSVFLKHCPTCNIAYQIDGYQDVDNLRKSQGVKLAYPVELRHPEWIRVSSETYLHRDFTMFNKAALHHSHAGYSTVANISNSLVLMKANRSRPAGWYHPAPSTTASSSFTPVASRYACCS